MKTKVYVRVGKDTSNRRTAGRVYVDGSSRPNHEPLQNSYGFVATVAFAVSFEIPDELFRKAEQVIAELDVTAKGAAVAAEIAAPE